MSGFPKVDLPTTLAVLFLSITLPFHKMQTRQSKAQAPNSSTGSDTQAAGAKRKATAGTKTGTKTSTRPTKTATGSGKKAASTTGTSSKITPEQLALYNSIHSQLKAQQKADNAAKDEGMVVLIFMNYSDFFLLAIRNKNQQLMEQEAGDSEGSQEEDADSPPPKKPRTGKIILDSEETAYAGDMRPIRLTPAATSQYQDVDIDSDAVGEADGEADGGQSEQGDADVDGWPDEDGGEDTGFVDNGVCFQFCQ